MAGPLPNNRKSSDLQEHISPSGSIALPETEILLPGWQLKIAHALWIALALLTLVVTAAAIQPRYHLLSTTVADPTLGTGLGELTPADVQTLESLGLSLTWYAGFLTLLEVGAVPCFLLVAALTIWRGGNRRDATIMSLLLLPVGSVTNPLIDTLMKMEPGWALPALLLKSIGTATFLLSLASFPDGDLRNLRPRWIRWIVAGWLFYIVLWWVFPSLRLNTIGLIETPHLVEASHQLFLTLIFASCMGCILLGMVQRYRQYLDAIQRLQTRVVVFSLAANGVLLGLLAMPMLLSAELRKVLVYRLIVITVVLIGTMLTSLSVALAILRYRLYDIDIIIRRTLIYSVLTATLAAVYFGSVVLVQRIFRAVIGPSNDLAIVISTLAIAVLFTPLRRRIQNVMDRRFYRRKYDAEQTLERFSRTLRDAVDLETLKSSMLNVIEETMQPTHVALWVRYGDRDHREK